jgi:hypothetical protein
MSDWYYMVMGEVYGPVDRQQLKQLARRGEVTQDTAVREGETGQWQTADHVEGLLEFEVQVGGEGTLDEAAVSRRRSRSFQPGSLLRPSLPQESRFLVLSIVAAVHRILGFLLLIGAGLILIGGSVMLVIALSGSSRGPAPAAFVVSAGSTFLSVFGAAATCFVVAESIRVILAIEKNTWTVTRQMADLFSYQATLHRQMEDLRRLTSDRIV